MVPALKKLTVQRGRQRFTTVQWEECQSRDAGKNSWCFTTPNVVERQQNLKPNVFLSGNAHTITHRKWFLVSMTDFHKLLSFLISDGHPYFFRLWSSKFFNPLSIVDFSVGFIVEFKSSQIKMQSLSSLSWIWPPLPLPSPLSRFHFWTTGLLSAALWRTL